MNTLRFGHVQRPGATPGTRQATFGVNEDTTASPELRIRNSQQLWAMGVKQQPIIGKNEHR